MRLCCFACPISLVRPVCLALRPALRSCLSTKVASACAVLCPLPPQRFGVPGLMCCRSYTIKCPTWRPPSFACCRLPARCLPEAVMPSCLRRPNLPRRGLLGPRGRRSCSPEPVPHLLLTLWTTLAPPSAGGSPPPPRPSPGSFKMRSSPRRTRLQALLFSQTGPYSSRVLTSVPSCPELAYSPALFRVLLLRRCACLCPLPPAAAGAIAFSTLLATIVQLAPGQVPCAVAAALSSALLRGFAARPAHASQPTPLYAI